MSDVYDDTTDDELLQSCIDLIDELLDRADNELQQELDND